MSAPTEPGAYVRDDYAEWPLVPVAEKRAAAPCSTCNGTGLRDYGPDEPAATDQNDELAALSANIRELIAQQASWQAHALELRDEIRPYLDQVMPVVEKVSRMLNPFARMQDATGVTEGKVARRGRNR